MKIKLLCDDIISVKPMSKEEYEKHHKKAIQEWARLERTYTRQVLFEKHEPFKHLIKMGRLDKDWLERSKEHGRR